MSVCKKKIYKGNDRECVSVNIQITGKETDIYDILNPSKKVWRKKVAKPRPCPDPDQDHIGELLRPSYTGNSTANHLRVSV